MEIELMGFMMFSSEQTWGKRWLKMRFDLMVAIMIEKRDREVHYQLILLKGVSKIQAIKSL